MFPYLRTIREFIEDCDTPKYEYKYNKDSKCSFLKETTSDKLECKYTCNKEGYEDDYDGCNDCVISRLVGWLINRVNSSNWGSKVKPSEIYAWCKSLGIYMKKVFSDMKDEHKDNILVGLEYYLEREENGRADVMLIGKDKDGNDQIVLIELKQWSGLRELEQEEKNSLSKPDDYCMALKRENNDLKNLYKSKLPTLQVKEYAETLKRNNDAFKNSTIKIKTIVYLHNTDVDGDKLVLKNTLKDDQKVFYKNQENIFAKYLMKLFPADKQSYKDSKVVTKNIRNGYQNLKTDGIARIMMKKENGEDYLRPDQKYILKILTERIIVEEGKTENKTVDIVYGVPGSGKTLIAACLIPKLQENKKSFRFLYGGAASFLAINRSAESSFPQCWWENLQKNFVKWGDVKDSPEDLDVIIIDEAHSLNVDNLNRFFKYICKARHIIILGDILQRIRNDDQPSVLRINNFEYSMMEKGYDCCDSHSLWTQFRCNADDGYVTWVDNVLDVDKRVQNKIVNKTCGVLIHGMSDDKDDIYCSDLDFSPEIIEKLNDIPGILNKEEIYVLTQNDWIKDDVSSLESILGSGREIDYYFNDKTVLPKCDTNTINVGNAESIQGVEIEKALVIIGTELTANSELTVTRGDAVKIWNKNKYRVLLTRAMKECYIYVVDNNLRDRFLKYRKRPNDSTTT